MLIAKPGLKATGERLIGEQSIEIDRCLGNADTVALGRNAAVEIGQGLGVIEPAALRHEGFDQAQDAVSAIGKAGERLAWVDA